MPDQMSHLTLDDEGGAESDNDEEEKQPKELPEYACK